ncbi:sugar phosphate isomerase/epimerase family protein [Acuticoccus mangrovi]|uniref:Sugar phosphate isomerase/epimerase n=1 Tax=Acuticoccus mangrovi TaxID=2796142 RepID=A0A934MIP9_9HYPH|nr:TIM barrel protein [Acuticoccus mangrovi]MBJ3777416.1 sugar phosphate isomerase/epimerase [Acuticoccus mangrovi]
MMLRFAYNTNGCTHHRLDDAIEMIADAGYSGVALSLDVHHFDAFADDYERHAERLAARLAALDLAATVDATGRYVLDPRDPYAPSLIDPTAEGRARRLAFLERAIRVAAICGAEAVSFGSGRPKRGASQQETGAHLLDGLKQVADLAAAAGVPAALAPTPGHMVATLDDFKLVRDAVKQMTEAPLALSLDAGHCLLAGGTDPHAAAKEYATVLASLSIEDVRRPSGDKVALGDGELDVAALLAVLQDIDFDKLIVVGMPTRSHVAHASIPAGLDYVEERLPSD